MRYLGVIGDGPTDQDIIGFFVSSVLGGENACEIISLGGNLSTITAKFRHRAAREGQYSLFDEAGRDFRKAVKSVLFASVGEFRSNIPREVDGSDVIIVSTDAEWYLPDANSYFDRDWAIVLPRLVMLSIEEFYHSMRYMPVLPLICPLVLFPSTDILVAAGRAQHDDFLGFRDLPARAIKRHLYATENLAALSRDDLKDKALRFLGPTAQPAIYRHLPESRVLLKTLSCAKFVPQQSD